MADTCQRSLRKAKKGKETSSCLFEQPSSAGAASCSGTSGQNLASSIARLQEIEDSIRATLGDERWWITPEEFRANIEAHRRKHDREQRNPKAINHEPASVREYQLKRYFVWNRQIELREVVK